MWLAIQSMDSRGRSSKGYEPELFLLPTATAVLDAIKAKAIEQA